MKNETTPEGDRVEGGKSEWKELEKRASGCEADKKDVFQDYTVAEMFYFFGFARVEARKKVGKNKNIVNSLILGVFFSFAFVWFLFFEDGGEKQKVNAKSCFRLKKIIMRFKHKFTIVIKLLFRMHEITVTFVSLWQEKSFFYANNFLECMSVIWWNCLCLEWVSYVRIVLRLRGRIWQLGFWFFFVVAYL